MIDLHYLVGTHIPRWSARFFPDLLWRMPDQEKVAYITFDDGPTDTGTGELLDILQRFGVKATFFLLGYNAEQHPGLVRAIAEAGHTLGNHTYSHPSAWNIKTTELIHELERTTQLIEDLTQRPLEWMRPPYGYFTRAMRQWATTASQRLTMWDVGLGDFLPSATSTQIERRLLRAIRPGSIIVLHDNHNANHITPQALKHTLARLIGEGWRFAAL